MPTSVLDLLHMELSRLHEHIEYPEDAPAWIVERISYLHTELIKHLNTNNER